MRIPKCCYPLSGSFTMWLHSSSTLVCGLKITSTGIHTGAKNYRLVLLRGRASRARWAVERAGIWLSASLVSLFWLSWKELLPPGCAAAQHPPAARAWRDTGEENRWRSFFPVCGCKYQHRDQGSGNFQSSSPHSSHFFSASNANFEKNHQYFFGDDGDLFGFLFLWHTWRGGEGMKEIWKYEWGNIFRLWLRMFCLLLSSGSYVLPAGWH